MHLFLTQLVYELACEPKRLAIIEGAGHGLDEAAHDVHMLVLSWLIEELGGPADK